MHVLFTRFDFVKWWMSHFMLSARLTTHSSQQSQESRTGERDPPHRGFGWVWSEPRCCLCWFCVLVVLAKAGRQSPFCASHPPSCHLYTAKWSHETWGCWLNESCLPL